MSVNIKKEDEKIVPDESILIMTCLKWKMSYIQKSREQVDRNSASLMFFFSVCFHLSVFLFIHLFSESFEEVK